MPNPTCDSFFTGNHENKVLRLDRCVSFSGYHRSGNLRRRCLSNGLGNPAKLVPFSLFWDDMLGSLIILPDNRLGKTSAERMSYIPERSNSANILPKQLMD